MDNYYYEDEFTFDVDMYFSIKSRGSSQNLSFQVIKTTDLQKFRECKIEEASEFTSLSKDESIIVLVNYQWNMEKLRDNWYENVDENKIKCGISLSKNNQYLLKNLKNDNKRNHCLVCYADYKKISFFSLKCEHQFCHDCWKGYLESKTEDILTMICATCPQQGCPLICHESVFRKFLSKESNEIMDRAILKNFTDYNADMKWCPTPNCGICIQCFSHNSKEIECECKAVFCFTCSKESHRPCPCEMIQTWDTKNSSESENVKWLTANTKKCPNCHKFIEKNQGCNHMTCRKEAGGCGHEFCWICYGEWKSHGGDFYNCNKFDTKKLKNDEKLVKNVKLELNRYVFYFNRYMNHQKSLQFGIKMRTTIQSIIKKFNEQKNIPYDELKYLENAVEVIIKSHRALKNTYIFGFYMKEVRQKALFEHNQNLLEKDADYLHENMEGEELKTLLLEESTIEFNKKWGNFKANVINLSTVTVKYMTNLVNEIELKLIDCIDFKALNFK